jgi:hypothetical protein
MTEKENRDEVDLAAISVLFGFHYPMHASAVTVIDL